MKKEKEKKEYIQPQVEKQNEEDLPVWNFPLQQRSVKAKTLEEALKKLNKK